MVIRQRMHHVAMRRALSGYCKQLMRIRQGRRATTCSSAVFAWATPDGNLLRTTCRENDCRRRCRRSPVSRLLNASTYQATPCRYRLWSACERPFSDPSLFHKNDWKGGGCRMSAFSASSLEPDRPLTAPKASAGKHFPACPRRLRSTADPGWEADCLLLGCGSGK